MSQAMTQPYTTPIEERGPRLWPGVAIVLLYWAALKVPAWVVPGTMTQFMISGFGSMLLALAFVVWWLVFSRMTIMAALRGLVRAVKYSVWWLFCSGAWFAD